MKDKFFTKDEMAEFRRKFEGRHNIKFDKSMFENHHPNPDEKKTFKRNAKEIPRSKGKDERENSSEH